MCQGRCHTDAYAPRRQRCVLCVFEICHCLLPAQYTTGVWGNLCHYMKEINLDQVEWKGNKLRESGENKDKERRKWRVRGRERKDAGKVYWLHLSPEGGKLGEWASKEQKRKMFPKEQRSHRFCEDTQILEHLCWSLGRELKSRNFSQLQTTSASSSLFWVQVALTCFRPQLLPSFPAAEKASRLVEAWMCHLLSPQQWNNISQTGREWVPST